MSLRAIISAEIEQLRKAMIVSIGGLAQQTKADFIHDREQLKEFRHRLALLDEKFAKLELQFEQRVQQLETRLTMVAGNGNRMPTNG